MILKFVNSGVCRPLQDKAGAFMVRDSSTPGTYTVSVYTKAPAGYQQALFIYLILDRRFDSAFVFTFKHFSHRLFLTFEDKCSSDDLVCNFITI